MKAEHSGGPEPFLMVGSLPSKRGIAVSIGWVGRRVPTPPLPNDMSTPNDTGPRAVAGPFAADALHSIAAIAA